MTKSYFKILIPCLGINISQRNKISLPNYTIKVYTTNWKTKKKQFAIVTLHKLRLLPILICIISANCRKAETCKHNIKHHYTDSSQFRSPFTYKTITTSPFLTTQLHYHVLSNVKYSQPYPIHTIKIVVSFLMLFPTSHSFALLALYLLRRHTLSSRFTCESHAGSPF